MCYMMRRMNEKILRQQVCGLEGEDCRNIEGGDQGKPIKRRKI